MEPDQPEPLPPRRSRVMPRQVLEVIGGMAVAVGGAMLWRVVHLPLPWLVGALYAVAFARIAGLPLRPLPAARQLGQWVIGANIGLYFTAGVLSELLSHVWLIGGMALAAMTMGILGAALVVRLGLADAPTAFFSSLPGGASEMANLADLWSAAVDRVAAAHAIRVMLVVLIIPLALSLGDMHGSALSALVPRELVWSRMPLMAAASLGGVGVFLVLRLPNAWVLGTLLPIAVLSAMEIPLSALPDWMKAAGQVLIGVSLGNRFGPGFLRKAPGFLGAIALLSLVFLLVVGLAGFLLAPASGLGVANLILSFSPGGIAEMSITASNLNLAVPLVVASHVTRLVLLMVLAPLTYRFFLRWMSRPL